MPAPHKPGPMVLALGIFPSACFSEVNFPYRKKNPRPAGDKSDVDSLDVGAWSFGGSGPLDQKAKRA